MERIPIVAGIVFMLFSLPFTIGALALFGTLFFIFGLGCFIYGFVAKSYKQCHICGLKLESKGYVLHMRDVHAKYAQNTIR